MEPPNREVVFRVRVVRDVRAKLCASYPGYLGLALEMCPAAAAATAAAAAAAAAAAVANTTAPTTTNVIAQALLLSLLH